MSDYQLLVLLRLSFLQWHVARMLVFRQPAVVALQVAMEAPSSDSCREGQGEEGYDQEEEGQ